MGLISRWPCSGGGHWPGGFTYSGLEKFAQDDLQMPVVDSIWFVPPGSSLADGLCQIRSMEDNANLVEATRHGVVSIYVEGIEQPSYVGDNEDGTSGWDQPFDADDSVVGAHVGVVHLISDSDCTSDEEFLRAMDNLGISQYRRKYRTTYLGDGVEVDMTTELVGVNERVGLNDINEARPEEMKVDSTGINDMNRVDNTPLQHESDGDGEESEDSDFEVGEQTLNNSPASSYRGPSDSNHDVADKIEGDEVNSVQNWIYYDPDCDHKQLELKPKLRFLNPTQFKEAVVNYTMARGADIYWVHSSKKNKEVVCAVQGCPWPVYASWFGDKEAFVIKSVGEDHACPRTTTITISGRCGGSILAVEEPRQRKRRFASVVAVMDRNRENGFCNWAG
ncbi:hypothetical protein LINGRAHAP2_LOCUS6933 [Linum grandiflorum]